jgi:hypothetical protein
MERAGEARAEWREQAGCFALKRLTVVMYESTKMSLQTLRTLLSLEGALGVNL